MARQPTYLSRAIKKLALIYYRRQGWRAEGKPPAHIRKYVIVAAPHTSNWDFLYFLGLTTELGIPARFVGKKELFRWPMKRFMEDMGGISVDRSGHHDYVRQIIEEFNAADELALVIAPEGTRARSRKWRTGFYHIAIGAGVPIYCGLMDYGRKVGGLGTAIEPTGDYAADMKKILHFYRSVTPKYPDKGLPEEVLMEAPPSGNIAP